MSIALADQVMRLRMKSATDKLVLLAFAHHSGDDDLAYPSVDLVAAEALCSGRTVQRVIKQLIADGFLSVGRRASGRGYPTGYRVHPDALGPVPEYRELRESQRAESHPPIPGSSDFDGRQGSLLPVDNSQKGDTWVSPFPPVDNSEKGDKNVKKGDKSAQKGDIAVSPEPRTYNHKARAGARPVDNSRADGARETRRGRHPFPPEQRQQRPPPSRSRPHPDHYKPDDYRESIESITEKARKHSLQPRQKWENEFAFRNRVNAGVAQLQILERTCRRLNIAGRKQNESLDDFEIRVTNADLAERGLASTLPAAEARRRALEKARQQ